MFFTGWMEHIIDQTVQGNSEADDVDDVDQKRKLFTVDAHEGAIINKTVHRSIATTDEDVPPPYNTLTMDTIIPGVVPSTLHEQRAKTRRMVSGVDTNRLKTRDFTSLIESNT